MQYVDAVEGEYEGAKVADNDVVTVCLDLDSEEKTIR